MIDLEMSTGLDGGRRPAAEAVAFKLFLDHCQGIVLNLFLIILDHRFRGSFAAGFGCVFGDGFGGCFGVGFRGVLGVVLRMVFGVFWGSFWRIWEHARS